MGTRVNKTQNNLQKAWDYLDAAYENMEKAFEILYLMSTASDELKRSIDMFDISAISGIKADVEEMIEE